MMLDEPLANRMARIALGHVTREYPHKLDHVLDGDGDALPPRALHPIFFGSFDWHSCVHGWWLLLRLARLFPAMAAVDQIAALAASSFTADKVAAERAYLARPSARGFERPYGWAWLLMLHAEMTAAGHPCAPTLAPLASDFARRFHDHLPALTYPIRSGAHGNTAFALVLASRWAAAHDRPLLDLMAQRARHWFGADRAAQAWEPDGDAFLSPTLVQALAMASLLPGNEFAGWFGAFLPDLASDQPASLFTPAHVSDRTDGKIAHLDGLNLSRSWCWRKLAQALPANHPAAATLHDAAARHLASALPHIAGDYAGEHWLASFALLALAD